VATQPDEETPEEKERRKENERWKDYANALLIAIPILLAGLAISGEKTWISIVSGWFGIAGLMLVIFWYGRDTNLRRFTPHNKYRQVCTMPLSVLVSKRFSYLLRCLALLRGVIRLLFCLLQIDPLPSFGLSINVVGVPLVLNGG
jgi:hypothetical protein